MRDSRKFGIGKRLSISLVLCFTNFVLIAQITNSLNGASPTSVIQEYCKLDFVGARLSSQTLDNQSITELGTWLEEPGWDSFVVIRNFEIVNSSMGKMKSSVTVRYFVLGKMFGAKIVASRQHEELVTYVLTKSGNAWRIQHPLIAPHVSVQAAKTALMSLLPDVKDPEERKGISAGVAVLSHWAADGPGAGRVK